MIHFPNCKINLGLRVTGKRKDGYHNLETIFYPLPLKDAIEITRISTPAKNKEVELVISGLGIPGELSANLCVKAWKLLKKDFPVIEPVLIHLLKAIPIGAGLGGGSSDGTHTLMLLNKEFSLGLSTAQLEEYALQLGSDCPFFILNKPCLATGRGEQMEEIEVHLDDYYFVLTDPGIHVSTAWAFSALKLDPEKELSFPSLTEITSLPPELWREKLVNDFETPVFAAYPSLQAIKEELYELGAVYASLTGSGSCIYGIFHKKTLLPAGKISGQYKLYSLKQTS